MKRRKPIRQPEATCRGASPGFTIVELMVALTLAAIISMTIMIISNSAREIYDGTTKKVEVSNKFRIALLQIERDMNGWIDTANMEFFADGKGSGTRRNRQWDEGEELPDKTDALGPGVLDGGAEGYDEYATITEMHYVGVDRGLDPSIPSNRKIHDCYQAYFRTLTYIDGEVREANVEYMLLDPNPEDGSGTPRVPTEISGERMADLTLIKVVRYHDIATRQLFQVAENFPIVRRRVEVASNVTDFRLEYSVENPFDQRVAGGYRTPGQEVEDRSRSRAVEREVTPQELPAPRLDPPVRYFRKTFGYGSNRVGARYSRAIAVKARHGDDPITGAGGDHAPVRFGFPQASECFFAELMRGSEIYVFTESNRGALPGAPTQQGREILFPSDIYTVKSNLGGLLEFYEDIDSSTWNGDQGPILYKASFLPRAVRITLRVVDDKGQEPKTLQREVWVRRKTR